MEELLVKLKLEEYAQALSEAGYEAVGCRQAADGSWGLDAQFLGCLEGLQAKHREEIRKIHAL